VTLAEMIAVSVPQAVERTTLSKATIYRAIARGDLPVRRVGRRTLILVDDLRAWLAGAELTGAK